MRFHAMTNVSIGFWGFGKYCQAFASRLAKLGCVGDNSLEISWFDPFLQEEAAGLIGAEIQTLEELLKGSDILIIGLPTIVTETAHNLIWLEKTLSTLKRKDGLLKVKLIVGFDALPLDEIIADADLSLASAMFNMAIADGNSPIALRFHRDNHGNINALFERIIRRCAETSPVIVCNQRAEISLARIVIGSGLLLPSICPASCDLNAWIIQEFQKFFKLLANDRITIGEPIKTSLEGIAACLVREGFTDKSPRERAEELSHRGGYTNLFYREWAATGLTAESLLVVFQSQLRDAIASSIDALSRRFEASAMNCVKRLDIEALDAELESITKVLLHEWTGALLWCNVFRPYESGNKIRMASADEHAQTILEELFSSKSISNVISTSKLLRTSSRVDSAFYIKLKDCTSNDLKFSGRYHDDVSGIMSLHVDSDCFTDISKSTTLQDISKWTPNPAHLEHAKHQLNWLKSESTDFDLRIEHFLRYIAVITAAYNQKEWRNTLFVPGSQGGEILRALSVGGNVELGHPVSTALSHLARSAFGLIHEWTAEVAMRRAARAAVFARNFSHITGSHVISNPEFRLSLVGEDLMRGFRKKLEESHRGFVDAENDLFRFMLEKAYKVEDLWTAGTKVLANAREEMGTGGRLMENTRRFHEYLQGRFDFIARAIDDTQDQPEPLWFVKDLVEGFLSQTAYLDTLVADVGLRREKMEFVVKLPDGNSGSATFLAEWKPDPRTDALMVNWKNMPGTSGKIGDYATLVALPGGMVSAHAFYSLLENIIRNSAKYGSLKEIRQKNGTAYQMVIELVRGSDDKESPKQHFDLRIWDNYSGTKKKDKDGKWLDDQVKPLQKRLEQDFVKPTGEQTTENLGMMEMQACAQMLYRGEDKGIYPDEQADHVCAVPGIKDEERKRKARQFNLWTDEENEARKVDGHFLLTYHLTLNVPVLLATLTGKTGEGSLSCRTNSLEKVRKNWPHLLILDGTANGEADQWLKDIAKNPEAVPYRTLVLCNGESIGCTNNWKGKIEVNGLDKRVRLLANKDLYELIFANDNSDQEKEKAAILAAYEAWLRAWKGSPTGGQWHLWIGMERPVDQVKEGWETAVRGFNDKPSSIRVSVRSFESGQAKDVLGVRHDDEDYHKATEVGEKAAKEMFHKEKEWEKAETPEKRYWLAERASAAKDKRALVFDNHGNCFPGAYEAEKVTNLENGTRFYQKLSGTVSPDLFRTLSRPPADEFGFAFFIYSLVESCLTNIAVVDERVAWNLIEGGSGGQKNDHFAEHLAEHQKAGVFPVFRFRQEGAVSESGFYNATHRDLVEKCLAQGEALTEEGVTFNADTPTQSRIRFLRTTKKGDVSSFESIEASPKSPFAPDVLLIHEGAMDILTSEQGVKWPPREDGKGAEEKYLNALYALAPAIVRTSGRGRKSKLLGEHLPFIEFGEVSSALLTARNKFSLVRGLLGSAGTERKP